MENIIYMIQILEKKVKIENPTPQDELEKVVRIHGKVVRSMETGEAFGEKALFENSRRTATIIAAVDSEFLILQKSDLKTVFSMIKSVIEDRRMLILKSFNLMKHGYGNILLDNMIYSFVVGFIFEN
jgi:hypothetical protein